MKIDGRKRIEEDITKIIEEAKQMEKQQLESLKDFDTWKEWKNLSAKLICCARSDKQQ